MVLPDGSEPSEACSINRPEVRGCTGDSEAAERSSDDWRAVHDLHEEVIGKQFESWTETIYSSIHHFLDWMVTTCRFSEPPTEVSATGIPPAMSETVVTPDEIARVIPILTNVPRSRTRAPLRLYSDRTLHGIVSSSQQWCSQGTETE